MSVRKRTWKTAAGEERHAWLCDYTGQSGKRHVKTFARKKDADAFIAKAKVEVREGVHTADSDSVTIRDAAYLWLTAGAARGLERATLAAYEQHARLHIVPSLGRVKLSRISAPAVRDFEDRLRTDGRSAAMIRKILTSLGSMLSDAQERGLVSRNVVRDLGSRRKKGVDRRADRRQKGRLKVGGDIPRGNQGHCWGAAWALAAHPVDGDIYRAPGIEVARVALDRCGSQARRNSRPATG
jgi:integrase